MAYYLEHGPASAGPHCLRTEPVVHDRHVRYVYDPSDPVMSVLTEDAQLRPNDGAYWLDRHDVVVFDSVSLESEAHCWHANP